MQNYLKITLFSFALTTLCHVCCGDSSLLHCARPLRTIFVSLAQANENDCAHIHKKINFPQAKLDSEINVHFPLIIIIIVMMMIIIVIIIILIIVYILSS